MSSRVLKDDEARGSNANHLFKNKTAASDASQVAADDPHKVERLTKAGRDLDPDEGTE